MEKLYRVKVSNEEGNFALGYREAFVIAEDISQVLERIKNVYGNEEIISIELLTEYDQQWDYSTPLGKLIIG